MIGDSSQMADTLQHRDTHPEDRSLFANDKVEVLRRAVADVSFLLSREYPIAAVLKLVGDRYALTVRQRQAVSRSACSDATLLRRRNKEIHAWEDLKSSPLGIDGLNCLITIESALSGSLIIKGRDGAHRDLASIHGTYRKVNETLEAVNIIGKHLESFQSAKVIWFLDKPVSNTGRLAQLLRTAASDHNWPWNVVLTTNPDKQMVETQSIVASSDSWVLDYCDKWIDLAGMVISHPWLSNQAWVVDLGDYQC
jgi:hypothetical protein